jgi:hypothetical protein
MKHAQKTDLPLTGRRVEALRGFASSRFSPVTQKHPRQERKPAMHKEILKVGNNAIEADADFTDGYSNGNLYYYDGDHQLPRPLTGHAISAFIAANLSDQRASGGWNAGFVLRWTIALGEIQR